MMHPIRWFVWVAAASGAALLTRNPFYEILLFGTALLLIDALRRLPPVAGDGAGIQGALPVSPWRFALFAVPVGALFNGLTSHVGETILARLPSGIPYLGGPITAEALVFGAVNGLVLATLFAVFAVLNLAVPVRDLIGYLPRAFYPVAIVSAIAVTFVPGTVRQFRQVREAQAIRGHRMRGLRDWLPLFMPVLVGGLERALQMAETMTARGFAAFEQDVPARRIPVVQLMTVLGLVLVIAGSVLRLVAGWADAAALLLVAGAGWVVAAVWYAGRRIRSTRYHRPMWTWADSAAVAGAGLALASFLLWPTSRDYNPYPLLSWPLFDVRIGVALLGLALPVMWLPKSERGDDPV